MVEAISREILGSAQTLSNGGNTKVDVQTKNGAVTAVVIEAGTTQPLKIRNPCPDKPVNVTSEKTGIKVVTGAIGPLIKFAAIADTSYLVENRDERVAAGRLATVNGTPAQSAMKLGPVQIGLFSAGQ